MFSDPPTNSLFDINNFKMLIELGMSSPNILSADYSLRYGIDFQLSSDWYVLTSQLNLQNVQQTYLIWLWLWTGHQQTFMRQSDGGNAQTGIMAKLGALAANNAFTNMKIEFPLLILASSFNNSYY